MKTGGWKGREDGKRSGGGPKRDDGRNGGGGNGQDRRGGRGDSEARDKRGGQGPRNGRGDAWSGGDARGKRGEAVRSGGGKRGENGQGGPFGAPARRGPPQASATHGGKPFFRKPPSGPPPSKPELGRLMARYGVRLPQATLDSLWIYHQFLRANNKDLDLTRLIGFETMAQRHYADCMILHGFMQGRWPSPLVDVGSGAGFPGIMIKLMSPKTRIVLAEPRPRRVDFLERAIKELKLKDISVFPHKVTSRSFTEPMAGAITRAFETVEKSLPRFGGCLPVGGKAIFMKGPKVAEELTDLRNDEYRVVMNHTYRIPNTTLDRALLVMERIRIRIPGASPAASAGDGGAAGDGEGAAEDEDIPDPEDENG